MLASLSYKTVWRGFWDERLAYGLSLLFAGSGAGGPRAAGVGGVKRNALVLFSGGLFSLLCGTWFLATFNGSFLAKMDNAYLLNLGLGFWLMVVGNLLLLSSMGGFGMYRWLAGLLGIAGAVCGASMQALGYGVDSPYGGTPNVLFAVGATGVAVLLLLSFAHWRDLAKGLLLGGASAALFLVISGFLRPGITVLGVNTSTLADGYLNRPPVLGSGVAGTVAVFVCPLLCVAIFLAARAWSRPAPETGDPNAFNEPIVPQG